MRAAAALLGLFGVVLALYTVNLTARLVARPDPMFGLEMTVSAILLTIAGVAIGAGIGLIRAANWARPTAIGLALVLILVAGAVILPGLSTIGGYGPPLIDPIFWLLGAVGIVLLGLVVSPWRPG